MLVLTRKTGEELVIGRDIRIVVYRIAGNRVTIGIEAPPDVPVRRAELREYDRDQDQEERPRGR